MYAGALYYANLPQNSTSACVPTLSLARWCSWRCQDFLSKEKVNYGEEGKEMEQQEILSLF